MKPTDQGLGIDDVVHAYRWLLGREPESFEALQKHLSARDRAALRQRFLSSAEFRNKFGNAGAGLLLDGQFELLDRSVERIVFLHVPKTGGTTLHVLLAAAVGAKRVCAERHNGLWRRSALELGSAQLFSGHYDRRCLSLLPGRRIRVVTMLREPTRRLVSLYKFLRAHSPEFVARQNFALAAAARNLRYGDFLQAALEINPASVDNTYLRAFGAFLPAARWEQRAEDRSRLRLDQLGTDVDEIFRQARTFLDEMGAVGILEDFDASIKVIFSALGLDVPTEYRIRQSLTDLVRENPVFEPVNDFELSESDRQITAELTRFDQRLYRHSQELLTRAAAIGENAI